MCEVSSGSFVRPSWSDPKSALLLAGGGGWTENIENLARNRFIGFQSSPPSLPPLFFYYTLELSQRFVKIESKSGCSANMLNFVHIVFQRFKCNLTRVCVCVL
jgi:hypothetical protein